MTDAGVWSEASCDIGCGWAESFTGPEAERHGLAAVALRDHMLAVHGLDVAAGIHALIGEAA